MIEHKKAYPLTTNPSLAPRRVKEPSFPPVISYYPSEGNFLLCRFERRTAEEAYVGLAQRGIFVRRFPQTVLDSSLRISTGTPEQTDLLIDALRRVV